MTTMSMLRLRRPLAGMVVFSALVPLCVSTGKPAEVDTRNLIITADSEDIPAAFWPVPVDDLRDALNGGQAKSLRGLEGLSVPAVRRESSPLETLDLNVLPTGSPVGQRFSRFMDKAGFRQILMNGRWYWSDKRFEPISADLFQQEFNLFLLSDLRDSTTRPARG